MAKVKNKRNSGLADKVKNKKKGEVLKKKLNPFEVHINREKIKVLGKKSKHDRGLPGVSRAKAFQKRKETLGTEMKLMNKTNAFIDRRIGEKNSQLTPEERTIARFAAERAKQHTKKNIFNLADDEEVVAPMLTHRGQTLEQIEKFDDPRSSDEEDDDDRRKFGGLDNDFVAEGHFGGGVLSKTDAKDGSKSHKDLIEQLIAESKKRKAEKQKEKEQTLDMTEKLDSEWKDLQPVVLKKARMEEKEESLIDKLLSQAESKGADYDKMMRELRFEKRGTPSDGLKSEEAKAKEEKEKLNQLEKERQQRMLGDDGGVRITQPSVKHRSAEDLEDNFDLDNEQDFMLAYDKDGTPLVPDYIFKANHVPNAQKQKFNAEGVSDSSSEEEDGDDSDEDDDGNEEETEPVDKSNQLKTKKVEGSSSDSDSSEEINTKKDNFKPALNSTKQLKSKATKVIPENNDVEEKEDSSEDESESVQQKQSEATAKQDKKETASNKKQKVTDGLFVNGYTLSDDESNKNDDSDEEESSSDDESEGRVEENKTENNLQDLMHSDIESGDENAIVDSDKIDSFFDMKSSEGDNLKELLHGKTPVQQSEALQKLIKSYDPSLSVNNKDLLSRLFAHLLQYINDLFTNLTEESEIIKSYLIFDKICPHMYDLAHTNKVSTKKYMVEVLKEKRDNFKKNSKKIPDLDTLIFFKLVSLIYPTSDYRHPVTTPSLIFMSEILTLSRFRDVYSISRGLFITAMILEFTVLSKRLVPSAINFLRGVLYLTANTSVLNPIQVVPPFRLHKDVKFLNLGEDCSKMAVQNKMAARDLILKVADNDFKIRCLTTSVHMLKEFFDNTNELEAQAFIFEPHLQLLSRIDLECYPNKVAGNITKIVQDMKQSLEVKTYTPITREKKKPRALRLYEPDVQEVFTGSKSAKLSRDMAERDKLQHKLKREMKGALREIRRDKSYIASVKIKQKIQSDNVRKDKVKQIYKDASIQQGELNKLKRMK